MKRIRSFGSARRPALVATFLIALACGSGSTETDESVENNPFAAETYDEEILGPETAESEADSVTFALSAAGSGGADGGASPGPAGGAVPVGGSIGKGGFPSTGGVLGEGGAPEAGAFGEGGFAGGGSFGPSAFWQFDDCSDVTRALLDSSGNGIHAVRTLGVECDEGKPGQSTRYDRSGDRVEALNAPQFALDQRLAVAAWVNPERTDGNRPVVLKRLKNRTAFSLRVQNGQAQFSLQLDNGRTVTARAQIQANVWTHVAGLFDGETATLFLNGVEAAQVNAVGSIRDQDVVIRVGGTTQMQRFMGRIDEVFLSTNPISREELIALACERQPSTLVAEPESAGPFEPGTTATYSVLATNNDSPACRPKEYFLFTGFTPEFDVFSEPFAVSDVGPGQSAEFTLNVTSSDEAEPGPVPIEFFVESFPDFEFLNGQVEYVVGELTGCHVLTSRELMIRNVGVVDDPFRTRFDGDPDDPRTAAWTFGRLMEQAAPSPEEAPALVESVFASLGEEQTINSFVVGPRFFLNELVLDSWPRTDDGELDLTQAPLRLLAIVNRIDLRDLDQGRAGEGRFVFGVLGPFGEVMEFTVILEYQLPAETDDDVQEWADAWHALQEHEFPSEAYNAALQALTERFTARGTSPDRPNESSLLTLRTNEIALDSPWQLREFRFDDDGQLVPFTVALTPDGSFNFSERLGRFINENEADIVAEQFVVPDSFESEPFLGGAIFNNIDFWDAPGILNNEARHKFSLNTCNGCHGAETNTGFLQIGPRFEGEQAFLSGFLTGTQVFDPVTGEVRFLDDLQRRKLDLEGLVCDEMAMEAQISSASLGKGLKRVH